MNVRRCLAALMAGAVLFVACEDEEVVGGCDPGCPPAGKKCQPLTTRENVLNNLELSYAEQKYSPYDELLDPNFTFFFSPGDVGGNIPGQWGRTDELRVASMLFDKSLNDPSYPTCRSIRMDLKFESGVVWVDTIPPDFPTETWYTAAVYYEFTFEMLPDMTYIAVPGSQAQFTVRNVGTEDAPQWRLVEWRDVAGDSLQRIATALVSTTAIANQTWGRIKSLYR